MAIEECLQPLVRQKKPLSVAVIGGGATGIEIAFALDHRLALLGCGPDRRTLTVFQAGPQILPGFLPKTVERTTRLMEARKMGLRLATPVRSLSQTGLTTQQGEDVLADLVVWAAGVRPNTVESQTPTTDPRGACIVDHTLKLAPGIYAGGDVIQFQDRQQVIPKNAQTALKMGAHIAKNILREAAGKPPASFRYWSAGALLWLGQTATFDLARISIPSKGIVWLRNALYSLRWRQMTR